MPSAMPGGAPALNQTRPPLSNFAQAAMGAANSQAPLDLSYVDTCPHRTSVHHNNDISSLNLAHVLRRPPALTHFTFHISHPDHPFRSMTHIEPPPPLSIPHILNRHFLLRKVPYNGPWLCPAIRRLLPLIGTLPTHIPHGVLLANLPCAASFPPYQEARHNPTMSLRPGIVQRSANNLPSNDRSLTPQPSNASSPPDNRRSVPWTHSLMDNRPVQIVVQTIRHSQQPQTFRPSAVN